VRHVGDVTLVGISLSIATHLILKDETGLWDLDGDVGGCYIDNMVTAGNAGMGTVRTEFRDRYVQLFTETRLYEKE
jgi:hypothetical protein